MPPICKQKSKERSMNRFIVTTAAAAILCGAALTATAAKADFYWGGQTNDQGQCYSSSFGWREMGFGYWSPCQTPARVPALTEHHRHHPARG
jgi:hypothetical protein